MPLFLVAKCSDDGRNRQGKSNKGACNTASSPPNINPTDEANAPLIYAAISAKCSDDGQSHDMIRPAIDWGLIREHESNTRST